MYSRSLTGLAAIVVGGVAGFGFPSAGAQSTTQPSSTTTKPAHQRSSTSCNTDAHWPAYVQGEPDGFDAGDDGAYLWHNPSGGWGLRVSHPQLPGKANRVVFTGTITSKGNIGNLVKVRDEKGDVAKVGSKGHTLRFRFVDYGGVDGLNFTTTCTPGLRVNLEVDKTAMQVGYIHLGDKNAHPATDPFRIRRRDGDTGTTPVTKTAHPNAAKPAGG